MSTPCSRLWPCNALTNLMCSSPASVNIVFSQSAGELPSQVFMREMHTWDKSIFSIKRDWCLLSDHVWKGLEGQSLVINGFNNWRLGNTGEWREAWERLHGLRVRCCYLYNMYIKAALQQRNKNPITERPSKLIPGNTMVWSCTWCAQLSPINTFNKWARIFKFCTGLSHLHVEYPSRAIKMHHHICQNYTGLPNFCSKLMTIFQILGRDIKS